nr:MAPEG family protein [Motiliproteus sediminis]
MAALLFTLLSKVPMNILGARQQPYDNHMPRMQQAGYRGAAHRAWAAHQNMQEAFAPFAAAVVVSHLGHANELVATFWCLLFLLARLLYQLFYLLDRPTLRSLSWGAGWLATVLLFISPLI